MVAAETSARPPSLGWSLPSLLLLASMLLLPTAHRGPKSALLAVVVLVAATALVRCGARSLHRDTLLWTLGLVLAGLAFMTRGLLRGEPGAWRVGTVYVLWPLVFLVVLAAALDQAVLRRHLTVVVLAALAVAVYGLEFVLERGGLVPSFLPDVFPDQGIGFHEGFVELRLPSLSVLPFSLPFLAAAALVWGTGGERPVARGWVWAALGASLLLAVFSGRRAVLLAAVLAPLLTLALAGLLPAGERRALRRRSLALAGVVAAALAALAPWLGATFGFDPWALWQMFSAGFDASASESSSIRAFQLDELLTAWREHPWFGSGHGAFLRGHVRDPAAPWSYELSYPTLLFQTGALGFALYAALMAWIFWQALRMIRGGGSTARVMLPLTVGLFTFLLANATNPYLLKFDFMWVVFLPLAWINRWLVEGEERGAVAAP